LANEKLTQQTESTSPASTDIIYAVVDPSGTPLDRKIQLANILKAAQNQVFYKSATELVLSSDAITVVQVAHKLQPESGTTDDLATISGTTDGEFFILYISDAGTDTITIKHGTGNISCFGGVDISLSQGFVVGYSDGSTIYISGGGGGGGLTYSAETVTTGNVTLVEGQVTDCTVSGMNADRDANLPTPSAAGVYCGVRLVTDAPAAYALVLKANSVEKTRLHTDTESVLFKSTGTGAGDWEVSEGGDGRIPQQTVIYDDNGTTWNSGTDTSFDYSTATQNIGNAADLVNDRVNIRRTGNYMWSQSAISNNDITNTSAFIIKPRITGAAGNIFSLRIASLTEASRINFFASGVAYFSQDTDQYVYPESAQVTGENTTLLASSAGFVFTLIEILEPIK